MTVRTWPGLAIRIAGIAALGTIQVGWLLQPVPLALKLFQIVLLAVSCVRPEAGLSILAGLGLLSTAISGLADSPWAGGKLLEQMVLAVVTGALVRFQPIQGRTRLGAPMAFYAIVAAASAAALVPARVAPPQPRPAPRPGRGGGRGPPF